MGHEIGHAKGHHAWLEAHVASLHVPAHVLGVVSPIPIVILVPVFLSLAA
jgi:Zn-dependent protease with chaperone function